MDFQHIDFREKKILSGHTCRYISKIKFTQLCLKHVQGFYTIVNTIFIKKNRFHEVLIYRFS